MLPGTSQTDQARAHEQYGRRLSQSSQQPLSYGFAQRPPIELPRTLEPRPTHHLQSSLSEASGTQRHQDAFLGPSATSSDYRVQGQSLPALRDIFTPQPPVVSRPSYSAPWTPNTGPKAAHQGNDGFYSHAGWHPPLALHPPTEAGQSYQAHPSSLGELPILDTSPAARNIAQSLPVSPYNGYPEARDYADARADRPRQASTTSYLTNGAPSPYTPGSEDAAYRNVNAGYDRPPNVPLLPGGPECQRKYLGIKDLPGEGVFHLYEGGFRIPTQVDGEQVNPAWGLTKANKPRKRLALACLDCREKKIKCEPGVSGCLQCEKAKRLCRRAPAQQAQNDPTGAPVWQGTLGSPVRKGISDPTPHGSRDSNVDTFNKRRSREDPSPPSVPAKKHRSASPMIATEENAYRQGQGSTTATPLAVATTSEGAQRSLAWEEDPYTVDPETVLHLLDLYFAHINSAAYCLFPRNTFVHWVTNCPTKCENERMVLYGVLAMGCVFADDRFSVFGSCCAEIAKDAIATKFGQDSLCVVQTRLLMSIYLFARDSHGCDWDYAGSAIRASTSPKTRLNTDTDCKDTDAECRTREWIGFSFTHAQLAECKRRTFWSCFVMDRFINGTFCAIAVQDIFLRLPCADEAYEQGLPSEAPFYNNGIIDSVHTILTPASPICPMAWLALVAAVWGDVLNFTNRAIHRAHSTYRQAYETLYTETHTQLQGWLTRLPEYLQYSEHNLDRSIQGGYAGAFIPMHALYNFTLMRMNRYVRHAQMPDLIPRNIRAAHYHARALLSMMTTVRNIRRDMANNATTRQTEFFFATPFVGHAIMSAIDVVGAGGLDANLGSTLEVMDGGLDCLRELAKFWNTAQDQLKESERRYYQIQNILTRPFKANGGAWLGREWGMKDSLEKEYDLKYDCIYADDGKGDGYTRKYFDALKDNVGDGKPLAGGLRIV